MKITAEWISQLEKAPDNYAAALEGASSEVLKRRPDAKNWAPVELVCHIRDVEESYLGRIKTVLAVENFKFQTADADRWAEERQYLRNDAFEALSAFRNRRKETIEFIKTLKPEDLERTGVHPRLGPRKIRQLIEGLIGHDADHLNQLKRSLEGKA